MADTGLALQLFMSGEDDIVIKEAWYPNPGDPMPQMPGCFVGKKFGSGALAFNRIFDIVDDQGRSTDQALKVCRPTLAARRSLAHEWKMFRDLGLLADEFKAARSHFLQAHRVLRLGDGRIAGIVMEKANGKNVDKTLRDPRFANVRYCIALLRDLLVGLDVAQRVLGFQHYDLKLDNVMEHWSCDPKAGQARVLLDAVPQFKIFDFGTAVVYPDPFAVRRVVDDDQQQEHRPSAAPHLAEQRPHNRRGKITRSSADGDSYEYSTPFMCVRIYHLWGKRMGDVFRVLKALCRHLDDRTWPLEDLELVSLLFTVLEHTTNSKRLKAKFVPRATLMHKLFGQHPPPPLSPAAAPDGTATASSGGLSRAETQALVQQHSQLVLQGSSSTVASQGSNALPSLAAIEAYGRQQQRQQGQKHKQQLQGVAEAEVEAEEPPAVPTPPLRINTTKLPTPITPAAVLLPTDTSAAQAAAAAAGPSGAAAHSSSNGVPLLPLGAITSPSSGQHTAGGAVTGAGAASQGQYTPRRSSEVFRGDESSSSAVAGMSFVRLGKPPAAVSPEAAEGAAAGSPAATPPAGMRPPSPFAGVQHSGGFTSGTHGAASGAAGPSSSGGSSSQRPAAGSSSGSSGGGSNAAAVPGLQQMVSGAAPQERKQRQHQMVASILQHQQQQLQQQHGDPPANALNSSNSIASTPALHQTHQQHPGNSNYNTAVSAATAAAAAAGPTSTSSSDPFKVPIVASAPAGVADPFAPTNPIAEMTTAEREAPREDPNSPGRLDSAGTIVAKQPVAPAALQSVLGSRKALRGVTAQQLLQEPIVQSLLSKI